jgi:hypothetical protein
MSNAFLQRLEHAAKLSDNDKRVLEDLCRYPRDIAAKKYISRDGDEMVSFPILLSGWAAPDHAASAAR